MKYYFVSTEGWLHLPEGELAQQMTKVESEIFTSILPKEYLGWTKKNREVLAPNISFVFFFLILFNLSIYYYCSYTYFNHHHQ